MTGEVATTVAAGWVLSTTRTAGRNHAGGHKARGQLGSSGRYVVTTAGCTTTGEAATTVGAGCW
ncbi:MAG: hypothetical protein VB875_08000 [Pirellulales bacterium]